MGLIVKGKTFTPAPAGVHQAVCVDVIDLGMVESNFNGEKKVQHKLKIVWQLNETNEEAGRRFTTSKRYTASLHEKSSLRKDLQGWRGRPFTPEELRGFDLDNVLGANCQLNVVHAEREGSMFANVEAVMPLMKGMPKIAPENYVREQDRKPEPGTDPDADGEFHAADSDVPW
jgi:hypothetical protein